MSSCLSICLMEEEVASVSVFICMSATCLLEGEEEGCVSLCLSVYLFNGGGG